MDKLQHSFYIAGLIAEDFAGTINEDNRLILDAWRRESSGNERRYRALLAEFRAGGADSTGNALPDAELERRWKEIQARRKAGWKPALRYRAWKIAAAVAVPLMLGIGGWLYLGDRIADSGKNQIARLTNETKLLLPDGSEIILDASTDDTRLAEHGDIALLRRDGRLIHEKQQSGSAVHAGVEWGTVVVPKGNQFDLVLADGTHVWLNADSRLRYPIAFTGEERRVYLEGEGYFDVTEDAAAPFIVEAAQQTLTVLGTEFNVCAYAEENITYTTLVAGSVVLKSKAGGSGAILEPGQQASLVSGADNYSVNRVETDEIMAWRNNEFVFEGLSLENVFMKLSRWYDFEYHFEDPRAAALTMRGSVPIYDDISQIFRLIERSGAARIEWKKNKVTVKMKK